VSERERPNRLLVDQFGDDYFQSVALVGILINDRITKRKHVTQKPEDEVAPVKKMQKHSKNKPNTRPIATTSSPVRTARVSVHLWYMIQHSNSSDNLPSYPPDNNH